MSQKEYKVYPYKFKKFILKEADELIVLHDLYLSNLSYHYKFLELFSKYPLGVTYYLKKEKGFILNSDELLSFKYYSLSEKYSVIKDKDKVIEYEKLCREKERADDNSSFSDSESYNFPPPPPPPSYNDDDL